MTSTEEDGVRPYGRMADSLEEAWNDLNVQLEGRRILLDTSVAFHHGVEQVCIVVLARLPFIRTGWPDQSSHQEDSTINHDYPVRSV